MHPSCGQCIDSPNPSKRAILLTLLPWPLDQIDHGTESAGHLLVLALGLVLLREMVKSEECKETVQ